MTSRRLDVLALVLLALACSSLLIGLERFPALSSDEAWVGLFSMRLAQRGLFTPHEMNTYTGPLYGLLLSKFLLWQGVRISTLRLFGVCANAAAFALVAAHLRRRAGPSASLAWSLLLASSAYLLLKSRLAWDVYALQPITMGLTLNILDGRVTFARALLFCGATLFGASNHFIYLSIPTSLCVLYGVRAAWQSEDQARPWLRLSLASLAMGFVVFIVKPHLSEALWPTQRLWALPLFFLLPPAAAAASVWAGAWETPLVDVLSRPLVKIWAQRAGLILFAAFMIWHGLPLWQTMAGPIVWTRMFSWNAPIWIDLPLFLWSALLLALLVWNAISAWHAPARLSPQERTLLLWPAAYASIFIFFRNTSSLRYYSLLQFLALAAACVALSRLPSPDRRRVFIFGTATALLVQGVIWRELLSPGDRRPLEFKIGWHSENSWDFARKDALFKAYDDSRACIIAHQERSFVAIPLDFHRATRHEQGCVPSLSFDADLCRDCARPPFYRWE